MAAAASAAAADLHACRLVELQDVRGYCVRVCLHEHGAGGVNGEVQLGLVVILVEEWLQMIGRFVAVRARDEDPG